jgi:hypothetical protein
VSKASESSPSDRLRDLVREEIRRSGLGERRFEAQIGLPKWSLRGFLDPERRQSPSLDRASEIATALGVAFQVGRTPNAAAALSGSDALDIPIKVVDGLSDGFHPIAYHDESSRRGIGPVAFSQQWLNDLEMAIDGLCFVAVQDSLLMPTVPKGALALVDRNAAANGDGAVWCIREDDTDTLAYLNWLGRDGMLIGGSPGAPTRLLPPDSSVAILGKVVWTGVLPG